MWCGVVVLAGAAVAAGVKYDGRRQYVGHKLLL